MKHMSPEAWQLLSGLWDEAMSLQPAERAAWLDQLRRAGHPLSDSLEEMLVALGSVETGDFLATLPRDAPRSTEPGARQAGERVGAYRLERPLGRGGMAEVWLARRADGALKRPVALKLLHRWPGGAALAPRFERERDILAALHHPHIASLFDAGVGARGESFLALEYVDGEPLTAHAERCRLGLRPRVELFRQVLLAVHHAHANLVLHRDLKPANILVDRDGTVKLLDFGIAKLLAEPDGPAAETELTRAAGRPLTPLYASPEQLRGEPLSTASDVYALGVVLYELLCGARPYDVVPGRPGALERAILEIDPRPPSQRVAAEAPAFGPDARGLRRALAGELDAMVQKALAKSPAQRYSSVEALRADVDRWLAGEPVLARPPGRWLRLRKFAARHRVGVSLGSAALAGLLTLTTVALLQRQYAREESARAVAARDFLLDLFRRADPQFNRGETPSARELLAAAPAETARLADQPQLQRELLEGLWPVQRDTDDPAGADATLGRLVALQQRLGDAHGVARAQAHQAELALRLGDEARSAALLEAVHASGWVARDPALAFVAAEQQGWLDREQGRAEAAQRSFEEALVQATRAHGAQSPQVVEALRGLMTVTGDRADFVAALAHADRAVAIAARPPGLWPRERIGLQFERADLAYRSGQIARSAREAAAAGAECDAVVGRHSETCLRLAQTEALSLMRLGETRRAVERLEPLARTLDAIGSPVRRAELLLITARVAMRDGRLDAASARPGPLRAIADGGALPQRLVDDARLALAEAALRGGELTQAAAWLAAYRVGAGRADGPSRLNALADLIEGGLARARGDPAATRRAFVSAHAQHVTLLGARHPVTLAVSLNLALQAHEDGRDDEARTLLQAAAPGLRQAFGEAAPITRRLQRLEQAVASAEAGGRAADGERAAADLFF